MYLEKDVLRYNPEILEQWSRAPVLNDSLSTILVIRGLPRPEKIGKLKK
jgi:hypothetical protein